MRSGIAAERGGARLEVLRIGERRLEISRRGEGRVRDRRAERAPVIAVAGLKDHRLALARALNIERTRDREELSLVVQPMLLAPVEKHARFLVPRESVILVAVPQAFHHLDKFLRAAIAQRVIEMLLAAVIARGAFETGGHHVPSRPALADQIERGELPRDVERLPIRGGQRADEPDPRGRNRERRQQRQRLEAIEKMRSGVGRDVRRIDDEDVIEFRRLGLARMLDIPIDVHAGVARQIGMPPGVLLRADAGQNCAKMKLSRAFCHNRFLFAKGITL